MKTTKKNEIRKILSIMTLGVLILGSSFLSSCSKDEDEGGTSNSYFSIDGNRYSVDNALFYDFPNDITYDATSLSVQNSNTRANFSIQFFEKLYNELGSGTYTLKEYLVNNPGSYNPDQNFGSADFSYDYNTNVSPNTYTKADLASGTLTMTKNGNNITIDLEGMTDQGAVALHYEGRISSGL